MSHEQTGIIERFGERILKYRLSNGLTVMLAVKPGYFSKLAQICVNFGAIDGMTGPDAVPSGIAHFLEHKLFEQPDGDVMSWFSEHGASCNAHTSHTMTAYYFNACDQFEDNLGMLVRFVGHPHFTAEGVAREKLIIEQEIHMYDDAPEWRIYKSIMEALYPRHPIRQDITGTVESIGPITAESLKSCHDRYYVPANQVLFLAGDLDPAGTMATVCELTADLPMGSSLIERTIPFELEPIATPEVTLAMPVSRPRLVVGFKDTTGADLQGLDLLRKEIEMNVLLLLLFGRSSDFYETHYQSGLIDGSFHASFSCSESYGYTMIAGETDQPDELRDHVLQACRRGLSTIEPSCLQRIRRKAHGRFIRSLSSMENLAHSLATSHFTGIDYLQYLDVLADVTPEAVMARGRALLDEQGLAVALLSPL